MTAQRVALVTGASSGFGKAVATHLTQRGFLVFGTSRALAQSGSSPYELLSLDVRSDASVRACVATVIQKAGRIDLVVSNAGHAQGGAIEENRIADAQAQFDVNVFGAMRVIQAVLPTMRRQGGGQIIVVSSILGVVAMPYLSLYSASKLALEGLVEGLRSEVRQFKIAVSLVEPTFFKTGFTAQAPAGPLAEYATERESALRYVSASLERAPDPERVAKAILRIARQTKPRLRYRVGPQASLLVTLRQFLPQLVFERVRRRIFHLDGAGALDVRT
jgi:NAD(P)-dependent dehydrogenase (short-subunit alcohol dehydrogenase family)